MTMAFVSHAKSLQAAQDMLAALETFKARLNRALSDKCMDTGFYSEIRLQAQYCETAVKDFAEHHEQQHERSVGFAARQLGWQGMNINRGEC